MTDALEYPISVDAPDWVLVGNISLDAIAVQGCGDTSAIALTLHDETASASYGFIGSKISVVSVRTPNSGVVRLELDLSKPFSVDTRSQNESTCNVVYSVAGLDEGPDIWHTLRIGFQGPQPVSIAALRITQSSKASGIDSTAPDNTSEATETLMRVASQGFKASSRPVTIVAAVCATIGVQVLLAVGIFWLIRKRRRRRSIAAQGGHVDQPRSRDERQSEDKDTEHPN